MNMKTIVCCALVALSGEPNASAQPEDYVALTNAAEKLFAEGSFAKANELYQQAKALKLGPNEARWVDFRSADTLWRAHAATETADNTLFERAQHELEVLVRDISRDEDRDRIWVEVEESLGDFFWTRRNSQNFGEAWPHYQKALDWWAGAPDIELARKRYLRIVWALAQPPHFNPRSYSYGVYGNMIPLEVLENAAKIAQTENDQAHAHYLIAMTLRQGGGAWDQSRRVPREFEAAIKVGKTTDWYDDALFNYAQWLMTSGRLVALKDGGYTTEPDYPKAIDIFRLFVKEFTKGESRYYESALREIKSITDPQLGVGVGNIFLPGSEIQFGLSWRNVTRIEYSLYRVDLTRDVKLSDNSGNGNEWLSSIDISGHEEVFSSSRETHDESLYKQGSETVRIEKKLPVGAYILEATAKGKRARDLVMVTDGALVAKSSGKQALFFACNALSGAPLPDARIHVWEHYWEGGKEHWSDSVKNADANGLAVFELDAANNEHFFASVISMDRQAFCLGNAYSYVNPQEQRKIYAFTDRPAYRPGETVEWKFIVRQLNGSEYTTPSGQTVEYEIYDPRGTKVKEGKAVLNAFGTAWDSLSLTPEMPLGEFRVAFWDAKRARSIGSAVLFRLEEYKLPEFKVSVQTPDENGRRKAFRLGEKVQVNIQADYYFGGAVANASVEVLVYQSPFYHYWRSPHPYPWYYEGYADTGVRQPRWGGNGQIVKRETIKTDVNGKASLTIETSQDTSQDLEYRVEARVTDASRREITGSGAVRVTRQGYSVHASAEHNIHSPQEKVSIDFKAIDANDQPLQTEGVVKVTRDYWYEVWINPEGREVKGTELRTLQRGMIFPPPPSKPNEPAWRLKFQGYEHDEILTRSIKTDTNGAAQLTFTPEREGYYRVAWKSEDTTNPDLPPAPPILAETTVWVANNATTELGYRTGGVQIIIDKDTFRVGAKAPVMLSVPTNDRYVLFSVDASDMLSYQLIHLTGDVKLIELPIKEKHVPNFFLNAILVGDRQVFVDTKEVVVPPVKNFLTVNVASDLNQYRPQEEGVFTITTRDSDDKPVAAEVAFGLVDESVYYIQNDYAIDPRQFFFGTKRARNDNIRSTFNQKSYIQLVEWEHRFIDDRERGRLAKDASMFGADKRDESDYDTLAEPAGMAENDRSRRVLRMSSGYTRFGLSSASAAMPMAPLGLKAKASADNAPPMAKGEAEGGEQEPAVQVRSDFRSTILWQPDVKTGPDGQATVKVKYPDSLTGWKATARAVTEDNQFGIAETHTRTKQPLIARLQAPRFFVVGDVVTISAVINNYTDKALDIATRLEASGLDISGLYVSTNGVVKGERAGSVKVAPNGEVRVDWAVTATAAGPARLKLTARGGEYSDGMEKTYAVYEHGIEKFVSRSGKVRGYAVTVKLDIPKERKRESTTLKVQVTPSSAITMLDALPYLIDYPYGCTEQTMSRFLPAAITVKTLRDLGIEQQKVMDRVFGGIEPATAVATHPKGKHDLKELDAMVDQGLRRLYDFQHEDGGWGWWKEGRSDYFMSAYVVWGLSLARQAQISVDDNALNRAAEHLDKRLVEEELNFDAQAWMLHSLATRAVALNLKPSEFQTKAFDNLWNNREKLNAYARALLALSAHYFGFGDKARTLVENLENGVKRDEKPDTSVVMEGAQQSSDAVIGTAHWGEDGIFWRWSDGGVETTAFALRALLAIDPKNKLVEPVSNWLIKNRRGAQWSNTRDTAITVLTLNEYLRSSGELTPDLEYEVWVNGQSIAARKLAGADVFAAPSQYVIDTKLIRDGENEIRIARKGGRGAIYFAAAATYFSLEEPVTPAGNEIFVRRQYFKWVGHPTLLKGYVYDRQPLADHDVVRSGDRVETVLTIEAKNNYEYLVFEDLKPGGFESTAVRSGESLWAQELKSDAVDRKLRPADKVDPQPSASSAAAMPSAIRARRSADIPSPRIAPVRPSVDEDHTGRTQWVYQELRDRKVALFIDKLPQGVWEIKYDFRAETPGQFHALPVVGHAMYVPEIRCNGTEIRLTVEDVVPTP